MSISNTKFRFNILSYSTLSAAALASLVSFNASAVDGTITFTGEIIDQTCTISVGGSNLTVDLGQVSKSSLQVGASPAIGTQAGSASFQIALTGCPAGEVTARFDGTVDGDNPELLAVSGTSPATNVGIRIVESVNNQSIVVGAAPTTFAQIDATGNAMLNYVAKYETTTASAVTAGDAGAIATYTLSYR